VRALVGFIRIVDGLNEWVGRIVAWLTLVTVLVCAAVVVGLGADLVTGATAAIAALGNIGPGLNQVGPMAHYADLQPVSRIGLTLTMWIGRLEVLTVLVILRPEAWRSGQWTVQRRHVGV
jgi:trk system potassium uptake protein TrkH